MLTDSIAFSNNKPSPPGAAILHGVLARARQGNGRERRCDRNRKPLPL
jgi:hypothetical protein